MEFDMILGEIKFNINNKETYKQIPVSITLNDGNYTNKYSIIFEINTNYIVIPEKQVMIDVIK